MRHKLSLFIAFLTFGIGSAHAQEGVPQPFHFSSRGTGFGVQGEYEGTYVLRGDAVEVSVSKATIYVSENCPYQGRRLVTRLKIGLGVTFGPKGEWKIESSGEPVYIEQVMSPKDEFPLFNLFFSIPIPKGENTDLAKRWLVAEIETDAMDVAPEKRRKGYVYAHSCKELFLPAGAAGCAAGKGQRANNTF